jgi:DNA-binding transcriptional regulator YhcF (GntR family)
LNWTLDKNRPICPQLCEQLCARIAAGEFLPGQRLMSVREVAVEAGVNPNTVQRAFCQLEQQGVLHSVRGAGWFVSSDAGTVQTMQQDLVHETLQEFFDKMRALGIGPDETKSMVKEWQE